MCAFLEFRIWNTEIFPFVLFIATWFPLNHIGLTRLKGEVFSQLKEHCLKHCKQGDVPVYKLISFVRTEILLEK